jgi:cation diffusion facilitator CzcD-associated flavoprotein CzcO
MAAALEETRPREDLPQPEAAPTKRKRMVIIGGGFAGVAAARALMRCDAEVVLIDRRNHHFFQPLLYHGNRSSRSYRDRRTHSSDRGEAAESHSNPGGSDSR